jgi:hypothetical protein
MEGFKIHLEPHRYGEALNDAFRVIQAAHHIIVSAIEKRDIGFLEIESYVTAFKVLEGTCNCQGILCSAFLDEAVDSWEYE